MTKNHCDVSSVEFAKALRLTNNTVEPLSFTVPRIKVPYFRNDQIDTVECKICVFQSELFQDDLFPPTKVTWTATMTSDEWFSVKEKKPRKISLQPEGMECRMCLFLL